MSTPEITNAAREAADEFAFADSLPIACSPYRVQIAALYKKTTQAQAARIAELEKFVARTPCHCEDMPWNYELNRREHCRRCALLTPPPSPSTVTDEREEWVIAHPGTGDPQRVSSFEECMDKWFEGFNLPVLVINGVHEPYDASSQRVKEYYNRRRQPEGKQ